jgi:hypothetical protein
VDANAKNSNRRGDAHCCDVDPGSMPVYLTIGAKAAHLRELGMSDKAIARALGVSDKTVAKAISFAGLAP